MRNTLLSALCMASAFALASVAPASAGGCEFDHPCAGDWGPGPTADQSAAPPAGGGVIVGQGDYAVGPGGVYAGVGPGYLEAAQQVAEEGDALAYCERTFRSFDPASGTYLGYDGERHACP